MKLSDKIADMLGSRGFDHVGEFRVVKGPKAKSDILECWSVWAELNHRKVELVSGDTMTLLAKTGLIVRKNDHKSWHYGEYIVEPMT